MPPLPGGMASIAAVQASRTRSTWTTPLRVVPENVHARSSTSASWADCFRAWRRSAHRRRALSSSPIPAVKAAAAAISVPVQGNGALPRASSSQRASMPRPRRGCGPSTMRSSSARTRSTAICASLSRWRIRPLHVFFAMEKSSTDAKRMQRSMRSASSSNRSSASPTQRITCSCRSFSPANGSISSPFNPQQIALIVKSRRRRSSFTSLTKKTCSGRRWST
ncbi:hypothetical protein D3C75_629530 [compost metagenome]